MPTYNAPDDPITILVERMKLSVALNQRASLYAGSRFLSLQRSPGSIIVYPRRGTGQAPAHPGEAIRDVDQQCTATVWGDGLPHAFDLAQRVIQALQAQADATDDGSFFTLDAYDWDDSDDGTKQGERVDVIFSVRLAALVSPTPLGSITATSLTRT